MSGREERENFCQANVWRESLQKDLGIICDDTMQHATVVELIGHGRWVPNAGNTPTRKPNNQKTTCSVI
jgi:myo-inositol catabolism protein IolC